MISTDEIHLNYEQSHRLYNHIEPGRLILIDQPYSKICRCTRKSSREKVSLSYPLTSRREREVNIWTAHNNNDPLCIHTL